MLWLFGRHTEHHQQKEKLCACMCMCIHAGMCPCACVCMCVSTQACALSLVTQLHGITAHASCDTMRVHWLVLWTAVKDWLIGWLVLRLSIGSVGVYSQLSPLMQSPPLFFPYSHFLLWEFLNWWLSHSTRSGQRSAWIYLAPTRAILISSGWIESLVAASAFPQC